MNSNVSVIIPVYNEALNIEDVINGVKKYCENIIVVDDKSTDSSFEIIKNLEDRYPEKIIVLQNEKIPELDIL